MRDLKFEVVFTHRALRRCGDFCPQPRPRLRNFIQLTCSLTSPEFWGKPKAVVVPLHDPFGEP